MLLRATTGSVRSDDAAGSRQVTSTVTGTSATFARLVANAEAAAQNGGQSGSRDASGFGLARDSAKSDTLASKTGATDVASFSLPGSETHGADTSSSTAAVEPYTTVDPEALLAQMVKGIAVQAGVDGAHQVQLHLQPAHLGDVTLDLHVDGSSVSANVIAQSADVRDALVANQHHLARALADAGLKLSSFSADVSGGDARGFQQQQNNSGGLGRRYVVHETAGTDEVDASSGNDSPKAANVPLELLNKLA
jgi:flagellar hook-length control protein FliK